jgi:hypothetical protein
MKWLNASHGGVRIAAKRSSPSSQPAGRVMPIGQTCHRCAADLTIDDPEWLLQLNRVYDKQLNCGYDKPNYNLRYPIEFHGIVLPNQSLMVQGSADLLKDVEAFCK